MIVLFDITNKIEKIKEIDLNYKINTLAIGKSNTEIIVGNDLKSKLQARLSTLSENKVFIGTEDDI